MPDDIWSQYYNQRAGDYARLVEHEDFQGNLLKAITEICPLTGQRVEDYIKLIQMGSRWYDAYLNRWNQPDSIIPDYNDPQSFDRYAFVRNNPVNRIDPTGHMDVCPDCEGGGSLSANEQLEQLRALHEEDHNQNTDDIAQFEDNWPEIPGSSELWGYVSLGLDVIALSFDIYACFIVTYGGIYGAGITSPAVLAGAPEVPVATGLAGMGIAELYAQPVLFLGNLFASASTGATFISETKSGDTIISEGIISTPVKNSLALTTIGWLNKEAYISGLLQTTAILNDLEVISFPFPNVP
jgi:RHS repeat-associated protein